MSLMEMLTDPQVWILLVTLSSIEIVLGIDNLVFISIAVSKLPHEEREKARKFGIAVACITRIALLLTRARRLAQRLSPSTSAENPIDA